MTVTARDEFTYSAPPSSGAAEFTATDNTATLLYMDSVGSPAASDQVEFTQTFTGGTVTIRARWSTTSTLLIERVSTIAGTSNGTATLATITGTATGKPRTTGDLVRLRITVNRGIANASTTIGWGWAARSSSTEQNSGTFNVDGELTPSAGAFTVSGSSFQNRPNLEGTTPDTTALGTWARVSKVSSNGQVDWLGTESDGNARPQRLGSNEVVYALQGTSVAGDYTVRASGTFTAGSFGGLMLAGRLSGSTSTLAGYVVYFNGPDSVEITRWSGGGIAASLNFQTVTAYDDGVAHTFEVVFASTVVTAKIDGVTVATATGLGILTGDPGLGGHRNSLTTAGVQGNWWELDDPNAGGVTEAEVAIFTWVVNGDTTLGQVAPNPCTDEVSRDDFITPTSDIDGYPLSRGTWEKEFGTGQVEAVADETARKTGSGLVTYRVKDLSLTADDYCCQVVATFPLLSDPGNPGSYPYTEPWRYKLTNGSGTTYEDGLVSDLSSNTSFSFGAGGDFELTNLTLWPSNGQPKSFDFENVTTAVTAYLTFYTTVHNAAAGSHTYPISITWEQFTDPEVIDPPGPAVYFFGNYGSRFIVGGTPTVLAIPLGPENIGPAHPYPPFYYPGGQPTTATRTATNSGASPMLEYEIQAGGSTTYLGKISVLEWAEMKLDGATGYTVGTAPSHLGSGDGGCSRPYLARWQYEITGDNGHFPGPTNITPVVGYCDELLTNQVIAGLTINDFTMWPSGQPKTFTFDAATAPLFDVNALPERHIRFFTTARVVAGTHTYPLPAVAWNYDIAPSGASAGDVGVDFQVGSSQASTSEGFTSYPPASPTSGTVNWGAQPDRTTSATSPTLHLRFMFISRFTGNDYFSGQISHLWPELLLDSTTALPVCVPTTAGEYAVAAACVRHQPGVDTSYRHELIFDHTGGSIVGTSRLVAVEAGVETEIRSQAATLAHDVAYSVVLRVFEETLVAQLDSTVLWVFDLPGMLADETAAPVTDYAAGDPAMALRDDSGLGNFMVVDRCVIYAPTADFPCTGPPGNPYPPVWPPIEPLPIYIYRSTGLNSWDAILAPFDGVPGGVVPVFATAPQSIGDLRIRYRAAWVALGLGLEQMPPPNTPLPPGIDPCETLNPDPGGGDFPPIGDVAPIPFAGGRFFGLQGYPTTMFNSVFNATQGAAEMPYFMTLLSQAAARSGVVVGAQGGYKKFIASNGYYSPSLMDAFINSHASSASAILAYQTAGTLICIYIVDDFRVQRLWPTSTATGGGTGAGLSDAEVARIAAKWLSVIPGIRLGIRARPRTFSAPIPGLTVYGTQFDGPQQVGKHVGDTVTVADFRSWRDAECARVRSWPAGLQVIMSPNALHGGDGESGVQYFTGTGFDGRYMFSAAEWVRAADGWYGDAGGGYDDLIIGCCGYEYLPDLLPHVGLLDGVTYHRNALMALPAL